MLPASSAFGYDLDSITPEESKLIQINGNLIQNFTYIDANAICGKIQCKRTITELNAKNEYGNYYGNCRDYTVLLISQILAATQSHIQAVHCYKNNIAHAICYNPKSRLVFDNYTLMPKTLEERIDLTKPRVLWDSGLEKFNYASYKNW